MRALSFLAVLSIAACNGGDDATTDDTGETDDGVTFEDFISPTMNATGDRACYDGSGTWISQSVDTALQTMGTLDGVVTDFETGDPVPNAEYEIWNVDGTAGAPDTTGSADVNGAFTASVPICQPFTYKTSNDDAAEPPKDTYEAHQLYGPPASGNVTDEFNSVSAITYQIIPSLLGVSVDADKGIIAGTAFDCNDDPIEGAQVIVKTASGDIPESLVVKYFVEEFPNRDQPHTSADGLWVAVNVPEGELTVELWGNVDGELRQLGATVVPSAADVINISNIYEGFDTGVKYPAECLSAR